MGRREVKIEDDVGDAAGGLLEYLNVPRSIGAVISGKMATLHECDTVYSAQDVYNMIEIMRIDAHNAKIIRDLDKE